jgi:ethylmalonyl-CoA mutase
MLRSNRNRVTLRACPGKWLPVFRKDMRQGKDLERVPSVERHALSSRKAGTKMDDQPRRIEPLRDQEAREAPTRDRPRRDKTVRDKPWMFRTYAGHSDAKASNALYRKNLSKGQTGLSVAFDLPTQTGYDCDHPLAKGEVGKVGVPISHIGDMRVLFDGIPLGEMNTSMTINATAAWLLALYIAVADEQNVPRETLMGTTQNDIIKEYLSRGTYVFPPAPSMRLIKDMILFTTRELPKWNPVNVCSYHLQEAGATPVQELAFALATAVAVLDTVKAAGGVDDFGEVVGRISFFVNASTRFVTETCKMRAFVELWDEITRERYGVTEAKQRLFRYGVQVNSLGLTEQQPENNVYRILISMLAVTLSKKARARAVQLPAWNEALGLPRPWDQQWSLRMQQILAYETDLLDYGDIFDGSTVIANKVKELKRAALDELDHIERLGGAIAAVEMGYMKAQLVESNTARLEAIERNEQTVVGVNRFVETEPSPLTAGEDTIMTVAHEAEAAQIARLNVWRKSRDDNAVAAALQELRAAARDGRNIMPPSIACAKAGVTTGEWGFALRSSFGEYRAPTGVGRAARNDTSGLDGIRAEVDRVSRKLGRRLKFLVGKPGLDGHSNGAEQIAVRARDAGMDVVYEGIRLTPEAIVAAAAEGRVHVVGLSILSGSHLPLVRDVVARMKAAGLADVPVVVGGIIPPEDESALKAAGVAEVYTPKDFELNRIMSDLVRIVEGSAEAAA